MVDAQGPNVGTVVLVAVGAFVAYQLLAPAAASAGTVVAAATPTTPQAPGVIVRGRNASAFIPLPDLSGLPIIGGLFSRSSEAGSVVSPSAASNFQVVGP